MKNKQFFCLRNVFISLALFMFMNFLINYSPYGLSKLVEVTGGHSILDMEMKGYSVDRAYEVLDALGEEGRVFDMKYIIPLDFPFPLSYGLFYFITLTVIWKNIRSKMKRPWLIGLFGVCATISDWLENIMIINLLHNYPQRQSEIVKIASIFTQLKSIFIMTSILLIVVGLLVIVFKRFIPKVRTKLVE